MFARLTAKHPDQPSAIYFDYLDVCRVARATFSGNHLLDLELDETPGTSIKVVEAVVWNAPRSNVSRSATRDERTPATGLTARISRRPRPSRLMLPTLTPARSRNQSYLL